MRIEQLQAIASAAEDALREGRHDDWLTMRQDASALLSQAEAVVAEATEALETVKEQVFTRVWVMTIGRDGRRVMSLPVSMYAEKETAAAEFVRQLSKNPVRRLELDAWREHGSVIELGWM